MKRVGVIISIVVLILFWGISYYRQNLSGSRPAFTNPTQDVTKPVEETPNDPYSPGENQTNFPLLLPNEFTLSIYAEDMGKTRDIVLDPRDTLLISSPNQGRVYAVSNRQNKTTLLNNLSNPHGLLLDCMESLVSSTDRNIPCKLYVAEETILSVYDYDTRAISATNRQILTSLPRGGRHTTRSLEFNPNIRNEILISIGSTCDVCVEKNPMHGSIQVFNIETKQLRPFAVGLRNAVFITRNPKTNEVWATEMGRDNLGDNLPPDEINILRDGGDYGWPYCYGNNTPDTQFDKNASSRCGQTIPSHIDLPAHSAPLGLTFIPENSAWPEEYWGNLLIAYHGSWNRSEPTGYKIVRFVLDENGNKVSEEDFITGWLDSGSSLGRPVDLLATGNGDLYISDDKAEVVYLLKKMQ